MTRPTRRTVMALAGLMALSIAPAVAADPRLPDHTIVPTSAPAAPPASPDGFRQRVRDEMADWRQKMRSFDETVDSRVRHQATAAETRLRAAWDDTEVEARNVQTASAQDWARTKRAYEAASHRMALAWDKARL